jgi:hypothetical protein
VLRTLTLDKLTIRDERAFRHIGIYEQLKRALIADGATFRVPAEDSPHGTWDRASFLNLTFWNALAPSDVLFDDNIEADVVMHAGWHHIARKRLLDAGSGASADAMLLGESIASAWDLYLVGRTVGRAGDCEFLETQLPAMAEAAGRQGLDEADFEALMDTVAKAPERAFEDLRQLLFDICSGLVRCQTADDAAAVFERHAGHRFAPLLHHYELSTWILNARGATAPDPTALAVDAALRTAPDAVVWLESNWL